MGIKKKWKKTGTKKAQTKDHLVVSFRVPEHIAEILQGIADESSDWPPSSKHKEARRIFAHGLKELYGIDMA